jgi:hypothetical protein
LQRWQSTYDGGYQGRVIDYRYYEYVVSAKNSEEKRDITIIKQQSNKVVISDGGFQRNRG